MSASSLTITGTISVFTLRIFVISISRSLYFQKKWKTKSVRFISLSGKTSLVSISAAILFLRSWHVYFPLEFELRGKSCVEWEHVGENGISCFLPCILLLYIEWIWTNYCKLSRNFVGATTINCRVSFIDLYLVFPRNFRMVFLPNTNTVILLEPYCGTITDPGLPVHNVLPVLNFYSDEIFLKEIWSNWQRKKYTADTISFLDLFHFFCLV